MAAHPKNTHKAKPSRTIIKLLLYILMICMIFNKVKNNLTECKGDFLFITPQNCCLKLRIETLYPIRGSLKKKNLRVQKGDGKSLLGRLKENIERAHSDLILELTKGKRRVISYNTEQKIRTFCSDTLIPIKRMLITTLKLRRLLFNERMEKIITASGPKAWTLIKYILSLRFLERIWDYIRINKKKERQISNITIVMLEYIRYIRNISADSMGFITDELAVTLEEFVNIIIFNNNRSMSLIVGFLYELTIHLIKMLPKAQSTEADLWPEENELYDGDDETDPDGEEKTNVGYWYDPNRPRAKDGGAGGKKKKNGKGGDDDDEITHINNDGGDPLDKEEIEILYSEDHVRTKILTWNVRSAASCHRKAFIKEGIRKLDPDVIVLTETWFCENDQEFKVQNYDTIVRCDRPTKAHCIPRSCGGGVVVLAKKDIKIANEKPESLNHSIQTVKFELNYMTIFGIYSTGTSYAHHKTVTEWLEKEINALGNRPFVITGDLNLPELAEVKFDPILRPVGVDGQAKTKMHLWTEVYKKHALFQHVEDPTHIKGNTLDYIFAPDTIDIPIVEVMTAFDPGFDHYPVVFEVENAFTRDTTPQYRRKESPTTWKKFRKLLSETDIAKDMPTIKDVRWYPIAEKEQGLLDKMSHHIITRLIALYEEATPLVLCKPPPASGFLSRTTVRHLAKAKRLYRFMVKKAGDEAKPHIKAKLRMINKANRWRVKKDRETWEIRRLHTSKGKGMDFYKWMNEITSTTQKIGPILTPDGKMKVTNKEMAPAFNDFLCDQMTPSSAHNINWDLPHDPNHRQLQLVNVPGTAINDPMGDENKRKYIVNIHKELELFGYMFNREDIQECKPQGGQTRGQRCLPIVITYKDETTKNRVKTAAQRSGLWNRRNDREVRNRRKNASTQKQTENTISWLTWATQLLPWTHKSPPSQEPGRGFFTDPCSTLSQILSSTDEIKIAIRKAKRKSAAGPDGIKMAVYSEACEFILEPLQILFNYINYTGKIPANFKVARVKVLYKKKSKQNPANYRPISMSNHISKIWERVLNARLMIHLDKTNRLSKYQYGFRPKRGCHTNLLELWEKTLAKVAKHGPTIEIWSFDLQKAFDLLDHGKALSLCHKAGIHGLVGKSLANWLIGRTQYVECGKDVSPRRVVHKSCVQGSVLGPTIWLIYIQSLLDRLEGKCDHYAYADDVAILKKISTGKEKREFEEILDILLSWADEYGMKWGANKTQRIAFRYHKCGGNPAMTIEFDGNIIKPAENAIESLGILLSNKCIPFAQMERVKSSIVTMKALVKKHYRIRTPKMMHRIYQTYMLPKISYCSTQWHTGLEKHVEQIEKELDGFWKLSDTRLPPEGYIKIREQLILNDLIMMHKIWTGRSTIEFDEFFSMSDHQRKTNAELAVRKYKLQFPKHSFANRIVDYWNLLPLETRNMRIGMFKKEMKEILKSRTRSKKLLDIGNRDAVSGNPPGIYE